MPIINENDAIASDDIRYGDNDRLAALTAHNVGAGVLVLLTDLDGLYTADPRTHADADADPPRPGRRSAAGDPRRSRRQRPGERRHGQQAGGGPHRVVVGRAHGDRQRRPARACWPAPSAGDAVGTTFEAHRRKLGARKLWIAFAARVAGRVAVDDGARRALVERGTSLLPAGVVDVVGRFGAGDTVDVSSRDGAVFARGMVSIDAAALRDVAGRRTSDLPAGVAHEVIHRDDLVLLH